MISDDGWLVDERLVNVAQCPSPNVNLRPEGQEINLLVIHNISLPPGEFGSECVANFFCNQLDSSLHPYFETIVDLKVSSHLLIDRLGNITQFAPFPMRAWHAGASVFAGIENCNDYSIGIELEGCDNIAYTNEQYAVLAAVTQKLLVAYPKITLERIVGHDEIAPGRKTDPGPAFDWARYRASLALT